MTLLKSDASLRGKSKALAAKHGLMAQEVIQMYLFERFLVRLAGSPYRDRLVVKGGLLVSCLVGVANRTTMDLDATLQQIRLDEATIAEFVSAICERESDDGIVFDFVKTEPIREDDEYGGYRAHIRARYGRMDVPMKLDLTTGDSIVPVPTVRSLPLLFDDGTVDILSYSIESCLAEKFEAIVKRGVTTSRARDLYDVAMLLRFYAEELDWRMMTQAISQTAKHRGTWELLRDYERVCDEMEVSRAVRQMWHNYTARNRYAESVSLDESIDAQRIRKGLLPSRRRLSSGLFSSVAVG